MIPNPPAWLTPRYVAFWILIYLAWLNSMLWMLELTAHRHRVAIASLIVAVLLLVSLR